MKVIVVIVCYNGGGRGHSDDDYRWRRWEGWYVGSVLY